MILFALLLAAAADFDGRWNLALDGDPRGRVWWLEVRGAATAKPEGRFVGAPGGQMDAIPSIELKGNQLHWYFERGYGPGGPQRGHYQASFENGKLVGSLEVPGLPNVGRKFIGTRAPVIRDVDDGRWRAGAPVELFNGKDTSGWECRVKGRGMDWHVEEGLLKNKKGAADITSTQKFWNFKLHAEFRYQQKSNSGIGLRGRYEVQIYDDFGDAPSLHGNGALYSRVAPRVNASRKPGEWQTFDITLIGRQLTVVLNGKTLMDKQVVEGFTAMATDAAEDQAGPITLQGDHGPVEFRKITVTPLAR
ncbi:MAG: DUF1080 domain-containing protein [Bryobacterales bacterium]|nr:DUF1080 domain-containing protein [Bryobacterales bacterium]